MATTLAAAVLAFPQPMQRALADAFDAAVTDARAMLERDMAPAVALMAALSLDPVARPMFDATLQEYANPALPLPTFAPEVIVGGGAHAAIYASVRRALGFPAPLVLDASERFGGTFALNVAPSFYLNSRNRPGPLGAPGTRDALNVIPAAPMQPADIGGSEYQTDADLGLVVRCALALNATVRTASVESLTALGNGTAVVTDRGIVGASRVIIATGVGTERTIGGVQPDGLTVYSFAQWMRRVGSERFPLRDIGRVAVIGAGDGGRTVVESLAGIGPMASATVAALDYCDRIDWYGCADIASTKADWIRCNRTRYQRIAALLPNGATDNARVVPLNRATTLARGFNVANVNGRPYDTVIIAAGYEPRPEVNIGARLYPDGIAPVARQGIDYPDVYRVGPQAVIPFDSGEDDRISENAVGLFRLAPRTAALASTLPAP